MIRDKKRGKAQLIALVLVVSMLGTVILAGCSSGDAKSVYEKKCSTCHSLSTVENATYQGEDQWQSVVKRMQAQSTSISDSDASQIIEYLAQKSQS